MRTSRPAGESGRCGDAADVAVRAPGKRPSARDGVLTMRVGGWLALIGLSCASLLHAADHGLALAYPVDGSQITIDGDLLDWPEGLPRYEIKGLLESVPPEGSGIRSAGFRVGYSESENALYVAIELQAAARGEPAIVPQLTPTDCLAAVWVRLPPHQARDAGTLGFWLNYGPGGRATLMPSGRSSFNVAPAAHYIAQSRAHADTWSGEYRIDVASLSGGLHRLSPEETLELNFVAGRVDHPEFLAWVTAGWAHQPDGRGQVWLARSNAPLGRLAGQVTLWDGVAPGTPKKVRVQAVEPPSNEVRVLTDREGRFEVQLPAGRYRVAVAQRDCDIRTNAVVELNPERPAEVSLTAPPVTGQVTVAGPGRAQSAGRGRRRGVWVSYGVQEGLPEAAVLTMLQDREGALWLGMYDGVLVRFDGARLAIWTPADGLEDISIRHLAEDGEGSFWVTYLPWDLHGISCFDRQQQCFRHFDSQDGLALDIAETVASASDGSIWLATQGAPNRWDPRRRQFVHHARADGLTGAALSALVCGQGESVWATADRNSMLYSWNGDGFERCSAPDAPGDFQCLFQDRRGGVWGVSSVWQNDVKEVVLRRYDPASRRWEEYGKAQGYSGEDVEAMLEDRRGHLWIGTTRGLRRWDGQRFEHFGAATGLGEDGILSLLEDRDGRLWVGTASRGLCCYDPDWSLDTTADGLPSDAVTGLVEWHGRVTVGTRRGLAHQRAPGQPGFERLTEKETTPLGVDREGRLWLAAEEKLRALSQDGREVLTNVTAFPREAFSVCIPQGMIEDPQGTIWITFQGGGLYEVRPQASVGPVTFSGGKEGSSVSASDGSWTNHVRLLTKLDGLPVNDTVAPVLDTHGQVWMGCGAEGAVRYDGRRFQRYGRAEGLAGVFVRATTRDRAGGLWFATSGGLSHFDGQRWRSFGRAQGLRTESLWRVMVARDGRVWVGTVGGGVAIYDPKQDVFQTLSWQDGQGRDTVNALLEDARGDIWIGTEGGLSRYRSRTNAPGIRITQLTVDGQIVPGPPIGRTRLLPSPLPSGVATARQEPRPTGFIVAGRGGQTEEPSPGAPLELAGQPRRLIIEFEGVSLGTHPDDMVYLCQLSGHDPAERPVYARQVEYTNLQYGVYDFHVRAVDRDFNRSPFESLQFVVRRDYEQMALVGGLGCAVCVGLVSSGLAWKHRRERNRALLERNRSLEQAKASAEAAREAAESANRAKSLFLANMSHEIRTPMNAILGYAQILSHDGGSMPPEQQRQALETIERSGTHLLGMINDILDLSKIESGRLELKETEFDVGEMVDGLESLFRRRCEAKGIEFKVECRMQNAEWGSAGDGPGHQPARMRGMRVRGDEGKLRQALINLLGNAVKFTEQGGVTLRVENAEGRMQNEEMRRLTGTAAGFLHSAFFLLHFEVTDTGPGIAPEMQARLFQPFQQGDLAAGKGGTGLGLAITRRLVEVMHGEAGVESQVGQGSRFWIEVPLEVAGDDAGGESGRDRASAPELTPAKNRRLAPSVTVRALVVDDVRENRDILSAMLRQMGCTVEVASGGLEAIASVKRQVPDIVFLDIRMPGMDGMQTLQRLREETEGTPGVPRPPGVRFVAVSASVLGHEQNRCLTAGFDAFLGKPFLVSELAALLERLLDVTWAAAEPVVAEPGALTAPEGLLERLKTSARGYRVTELKRALTELEQLGPADAALARRLRPLAQFSRMAEVIVLIEAVQAHSHSEVAP